VHPPKSNDKQAASCEGEGFKRVKLRKEGLKGLEKFEVGKVRNSTRQYKNTGHTMAGSRQYKNIGHTMAGY